MQAENEDEQMRSASVEMLSQMADMNVAGPSNVTHLCTNPMESQGDSRPVLRRLQLISVLLDKLGISKAPSLHGNFEFRAMKAFLGAVLGSGDEDVFEAATNVQVKVRHWVSCFPTILTFPAYRKCPLYCN